MTGSLAARRAVAAAVMTEFRRMAVDQAQPWPSERPDWFSWAHRMATALGGLLAELAGELETEVRPDGAAVLSPADREGITGCLSVAAGLLATASDWCADCAASAPGPCQAHLRCLHTAAACRVAVRKLGGEPR